MLITAKRAATATLLACAFVAAPSQAQEQTIKDGVFTEAQAVAGQDAYDAACKACHDMKFYRDIWNGWEGKPLLNFWYLLVGEMPADNPGSLLDAEYTDIVAYILADMGFPAGTAALDPNNGMDAITVVAP